MKFKFGRSSYSVSGAFAGTSEVTFTGATRSERSHDAPKSEETMTSTIRSTSSATLPSMRTSNGNLHPASSDGASEGTPSEEHPEFVDINVILPNGDVTPITVEYGKQMMDLLVQVAAGNRLSPAAHTISITNEETGRPLDYKASQSIGSLKITTIQLVPKKQDKPEKKPKSARPFEKTQRLTVNLPRNQKFVTRVNPKATLAEIFTMVCEEKNMDMYKYELRHPTAPDEALNMASPLEEYGLVEIVVVHNGAVDNRRPADYIPDIRDVGPAANSASMPRMKKGSSSSAASEDGAAYMPGQDGARAKKKGMFSLFSRNKKAGSFKLGDAKYNEPTYAQQQQQLQMQQQQQLQMQQQQQLQMQQQQQQVQRQRMLQEQQQVAAQRQATSPTPSAGALSNDSRASGSQSPVSIEASGPASLPNRALPRKKRPAPAPPPPPAAAGASPPPPPAAPAPAPAPASDAPAAGALANHVTQTVTVDVEMPVSRAPPKVSPNQPQPQVHSRNSSHSSGFDESNISPLESPGVSNKTNVSEQTQISIDATSVDITETQGRQMIKSQSMPIRSEPAGTQIVKSTSLNTFKRKKRKAPAPPPPTGAVKAPAPRPIPEESRIPVGANSSTQDVIVEATITTTAEVITVVDHQASIHSETETSPRAEEVHAEVFAHTINSSPPDSPQDHFDGTDVEQAQRAADLSKDIDVDASSSSGSLERPRPRPCLFVPPPPPSSPPPLETPVSPDRARSFELIARGVEVVDSSIQVHVSSPRSALSRKSSSGSIQSANTVDTIEDITNCFDDTIAVAEEVLALESAKNYFSREDGDFSLSPLSNETFSHGSDSASENSSINVYEVNEMVDGDKSNSEDEEDVSLYPNDPEGIVLLKKVSLSEGDTLPQSPETDVDGTLKSSEVSDTVPVQKSDHVTVISVGGEPDVAGASDSGHSSATLDKSEYLYSDVAEPLPLENEITFDDIDVVYVEPQHPGNVMPSEEYHVQHEDPTQDTATPVKAAMYEVPVSTSTPMVHSVAQAAPDDMDNSFEERALSPVESSKHDHDSSISDMEESPFLNSEEPMISLNDYRVVGLIKEEVIDFSYAKHSKPLEIQKKEKEPDPPMVTSLRQKYTRRPIIPREPIEIPDLEAMGWVPPRQELPPPPSEPAPPPPPDPPELFRDTNNEVFEEENDTIYIPPSAESFTDSELPQVIEVIEPSEESELSIPNEAEPETLARDHAKKFSLSESQPVKPPVGILKHSSTSSRESVNEDFKKPNNDSFYSDSNVSTSGSTKGILKTSVSSEDSDYHSKVNIDSPRGEAVSKSQGILKNTDSVSSYTSSRIYSSTPSLYEKEEDVKGYRPVVMNNRRSLGVYGPRPWGATRPKSEANIIEHVTAQFSSTKEAEHVAVKENETVRQRMSEIGFSPNSEREKEDVLEEKSLSMMNLRAKTYTSQEPKKRISSSTKDILSDDCDSKRSLQMQYEELQQQFTKWQKQLMDNQALLSKKKISESDEDTILHKMKPDAPVTATTHLQNAPKSQPENVSNYTQDRVTTSSTVHVTNAAPMKKEPDARYEPVKKATLDYGGGGRFSTNDLMSVRSRLRSSGDDVEEKGGIMLGRVVETQAKKEFVVPCTPAPSTKDFPPPPKKVLIEPLSPNPNPKPIGRSRFEPELDPREELMIAIRNNGGRGGLRKVAVAETTWSKSE